jgi:hypothetical protein
VSEHGRVNARGWGGGASAGRDLSWLCCLRAVPCVENVEPEADERGFQGNKFY